jgi:hypothetical protein
METSMKKALITSILVPLLITPVAATAKMHRQVASILASNSAVVGAESTRKIKAARTIPRAGRNAFDMTTGLALRLDANSPEATGGGSLGYNDKLLVY